MEIPTVGPKTARRLHEELGLSTAQDVYVAAQQGKIRQLFGFGVKRERQLLAGAEMVLGGFHKVASPVPPPEPDELPLQLDLVREERSELVVAPEREAA
jgi:hypothetical protein